MILTKNDGQNLLFGSSLGSCGEHEVYDELAVEACSDEDKPTCSSALPELSVVPMECLQRLENFQWEDYASYNMRCCPFM